MLRMGTHRGEALLRRSNLRDLDQSLSHVATAKQSFAPVCSHAEHGNEEWLLPINQIQFVHLFQQLPVRWPGDSF